MSHYIDFCISDPNKLPDDFIHLACINIKLDDRAIKIRHLPFYLGITQHNIQHLSSVVLFQEITNNGIKDIAFFRKDYKYTSSIYEILHNIENKKKYNFYITINDTNDLYIHLYINRIYLLNLYEENNIPDIVYNIITDKNIKIKETKITIANYIYTNNNLQKTYKRVPYNYQIGNINWMVNNEIKINIGDFKIETYKIPNSYGYKLY